MKYMIATGLFVISTSLWALNPNIEEYYLEGHEVIKQVTSDLNGDGALDVVVVSRETDPSKITLSGENEINQLDENRWALSVFIADAQSATGFTFFAQTFDLIPEASLNADEYFDGLSIENKVIILSQHFWYSMGSWFTNAETYKFRMEKDGMVLIGFDNHEIHRSTGDVEDISVNFLTHKMERAKGHISRNEMDEKITSNIGDQFFLLDEFSRDAMYEFLYAQTHKE